MNSSIGTTLSERTERATGIGAPRLPSRGGLALAVLLSAFFAGALAWIALFGGWQDDGERYLMAGGTLLWLWLTSDKLGAYLFARRGVSWGRGLRAFGTVAFFPLSMGFYLAASWATSTVLFAVQSAALGILVALAALRRARPGRDRGHA